MTENQKQIVLKDLCSRLPYHEQEAGLKGGTAVAWKPTKVKLIKPITQ